MEKTESFLLALLRQSLNGAEKYGLTGQEQAYADMCAWDALVETARRHGVLPLMYETLKSQPVPEKVFRKAERISQTTVRQSYRLLILSKQILREMAQRGIEVVLLKGVGTATYYPVPELRRSGDVDLLLLDREKLDEASDCLKELGCRVEEWQPSLHHVVFSVPAVDVTTDTVQKQTTQDTAPNTDGAQQSRGRERKIEIELHTMLAEPFDEARVNELLDSQIPGIKDHLARVEYAGVELDVLDTAYHAYELLLHMLQHFLRSGFGLKLLCDWVVFWNREIAEADRELYLKLVRECGIKSFSDLVSLTCAEYLGLPSDRIAFMKPDKTLSPRDFMREILEAEEFGKSSKDRMVALRGNSPWDYAREFHHQMHLNYPKTGKCPVLWPVLWFLTLARFLVNNKKVRKISLSAVLRKAGQRGKLMKKLNLFRQEH